MENIYTNNNITKFCDGFKTLPNSFNIEKVHQLINNPNAKAKHRVNLPINRLKFKIMTSAFTITGAALILWLSLSKTDNHGNSFSKQPNNVDNLTKNETIIDKGIIAVPNNGIAQSSIENKESILIDSKINISDKKGAKNAKINAPEKVLEATEEIYSWPLDTTINKSTLILHLTNKELEKLGVFNRTDSMKYKNVFPDGTNRQTIGFLWGEYPKVENSKILPFSNHPFYIIDLTDTTKTDYKRELYEMYDTLIPIQTFIIDQDYLLWFTPHPAIFDSLPNRYSSLKEKYENLKRIKRLNPNHHLFFSNEIVHIKVRMNKA